MKGETFLEFSCNGTLESDMTVFHDDADRSMNSTISQEVTPPVDGPE